MSNDQKQDPFGYFEIYNDQSIYALPYELSLNVLGRLLSLLDPSELKLSSVQSRVGPEIYILSHESHQEALNQRLITMKNDHKAFPLRDFLAKEAKGDFEYLLIAMSKITDQLTYVIVRVKGKEGLVKRSVFQHLKGTFLSMLSESALLHSGQDEDQLKKNLLGHEFT